MRERTEDIEQLTEQILSRLTAEPELVKPTISAEAIQALKQYSFAGNVRELENILERAFALCENDVIKPEDLRLPKEKKSEIAIETNIAVGDGISLEARLGDIEKEAILQALEQTNHNKTAAAKLLGMSFRSLRYRLKKLGLD